MANSKGFSLVELMVVVGIIAILASFAVPQYESFQSKARQKEAHAILNNFYTATKSVEAEFAVFPGNFVANGFNPSGQLHYRIVAVDGTDPPRGPNNDTCVSTVNNCGGYGDWSEVTQGAFAANAANGCTAAINSTAGTFTTCASANIRNNAGADTDTWSINQAKLFTHSNDGIN